MSNPECCKMLAISGVIEGWPPQISLYLGNATLAKANTESRIAIVSAVLKYFSSLLFLSSYPTFIFSSGIFACALFLPGIAA